MVMLKGRSVPHDASTEPARNVTRASGVAPDASGHLRALYEATLPIIYRFVYSKVGNREEAEDLTSQVYLKALNGLDQTRDATSAQAWLFQVARTTIADHWRGFYRLRASSLDDLMALGWDSPSTTPRVESDAEPRVRRVLASLTERYRDVLTLRFLLNLSLKETASRMNLSEANVKVLQFRALRKASQYIEAEASAEGETPDGDADQCETGGR
jgi:RNA polymerase sigma-70 factor (ECF subfamily)